MQPLALAIAAAVSAAGCSQIFGLSEPARRSDASVVVTDDALPDMPPDDAMTDGPPVVPRPLFDILTDESLASGLLVALDAGDSASYPGTGQTWINRASGATDFSLGSGGGAAADDPTFQGTAGGLSEQEYFLLDGGDYFAETSTGWGDDVFHHNAAKVTIAAVVWVIDAPPSLTIFSNHRADETTQIRPGVSFYDFTAGLDELGWLQKGDTTAYSVAATSAVVPSGRWMFLAVSVDANGGTSDVTLMINNAQESFSDQAFVYGALDPDEKAAIGAVGDGSVRVPDGTRFALVAIWNRALSAAELTMLYTAIEAGRFPSLP